MALTDAQKTDVRRFAGYDSVGNATTAPYADPGYSVNRSAFTAAPVALATKMDNLSESEESVLTDVYLANLTALESGILLVADSVDTSEAGPWKANPKERQERTALFGQWRMMMCQFLGVRPGPGLGGGTIAVVRG